jgi:hypothetical protein
MNSTSISDSNNESNNENLNDWLMFAGIAFLFIMCISVMIYFFISSKKKITGKRSTHKIFDNSSGDTSLKSTSLDSRI